ncbi:uncharacterized protein cdh24b isoform X1 [Denticeps clupeoides]|uniref:uncharacterized protein cdh24b isoform X1 n=1 Tax=Denticeps clupeoides TaxID=299321 RepID=UPI0010A2FE25|nr:cadherin-24 isoform X1 [Denticeps clupeoides]
MFGRKLFLLITLFLWEAFVDGAIFSKIVRRSGQGSMHSLKLEAKGTTDQWGMSKEKTRIPVVRAKDLADDSDFTAIRILSQSRTGPVSTKREDVQSYRTKPMLKLDTDSSVHGLANEAGKVKKNGTKDAETPKLGLNEKGHHKMDFILHFNRTRAKPLPKSRTKAGMVVRPAPSSKSLPVDLPRKLNLTGSYGLLKLISKESLVRIVNSQLQGITSLNFQSKGSRSGKRDLIDKDHSQSAQSKLKRQDRAVAADLYISDNQTAEPHVGTASHTNPNSALVAYSFWKPVSEQSVIPASVDEKLLLRNPAVTETWRSKHLNTHLASTPQTDIIINTEKDVLPGKSGSQMVLRMGPSNFAAQGEDMSQSLYTLDPWGQRTVSGRGGAGDEHSEENTGIPERETSVTEDPVGGASQPLNNSHILKLPPEPEWGVDSGKAGSRLMTVDSWPSHGLVFEEADEDTSDDYYGHGQMEQGGKRSRSRRSWIWNQFFVIEEYTGPEPVLIGRLHTDMDRGDGRTKYKLRGEGAGSVFVIDEKTGNIHVTKPLDREEKDEYRLIATATDRQTDRALEPSSQFIIRVQDINDNPPIFEEGPYSATVPEMANIGTSIIQVTATDADDPTYGNSARLVYTLVQGQPYFSVDPQTGILRTAVPDMDRETQDQFLVVLQAKDMGGHLGGLSGTTTVTVRLADVNDNPPRFAQSMWSFSVSELAVAGAEVGRVSATDADLGENAKLEYTILEGETGDTFNITGLNQEAVIILNKPVDYESRSSYSFSVEVLNPTVDPRFLRRGPFKDRAAIRVAVLDADEPPRFSRTRYRLAVSENCPPACTVGRVSAVDPDTGLNTNIRFSIDPQSDPEALFRITPDSGLITTATELDREREQWHNVTVIATQRDSPSQVSRVVVAVETLDLNDNAPELDRQYTTAMCDSTSTGQVVQVLRAIDRDEGGNDSTVHFNIPPESGSALNFSIRESGGPTASLVLASPLLTLSRSPSSSLTLYVPLILRDGASGLTSTGTVTVSVCPCLRGGARAGEKEKQTEGDWDREAVCLPQQSSSPSPGLSTAALLAILACIGTLLAVSALSLSLRRQKRDSLSPLEEDDVRENIITYDDEGGGEADTAAFDITALQSAPHGLRRGYRTLDSRNVRYSQHTQDKSRMYSWAQNPGLDAQYSSSMAPLYGRFCYSSHTLPIRRSQAPFDPSVAELAYRFPGGQPDHSLVIQNQGAMVMPLEHNGVFIGPTEAGNSSGEGTASQNGATASEGETAGKEGSGSGGARGTDVANKAQQSHSQDLDWKQPLILTRTDPAPPRPLQVQSDSGTREQTLVLTRSGSIAAVGSSTSGWMCDSATLPLAGRRASRSGLSPKRHIGSSVGSMDHSLEAAGVAKEIQTQTLGHNYSGVRQGDSQRDPPSGLLTREKCHCHEPPSSHWGQ